MSIYLMPRKPRYIYTLFNRYDQPRRPFPEVRGGTVTIEAETLLGGSATFSIRDIGDDVDWLNDRVLVEYDPGVEGFPKWAVGYFVLSSPLEKFDAGGTEWEVTGLPVTSLVAQGAPEPWFSVGEGANIIDEVEELIGGIAKCAITESNKVLVEARTFTPDLTPLAIVNELLQSAGYYDLHADGTGQLRVEPYILPKDRPTSIMFDDSNGALHQVDWQRFQDLSNIPNIFWVTGMGTDETPGMIGVAENDDPGSPFSTVNRVINRKFETGFDGADQTVFDARAAQLLAEAMSPIAKIDVKHLPLPVSVNQVAHFRNKHVDARATIQKLTYTLNKSAWVEAVWREINV